MTFHAGQRIDRYELVEELGEGGQGAVWKAFDRLTGEPRALKLLWLDEATPDEIERARREGRALAKLEHPSLCRCDALFEDLKLEVLGLAMELVEGQPMALAIADRRFTPSLREAALRHLLGALAHVHANKLVHRDVKPENIILTNSFWDRPDAPSGLRLVDFGIVVSEQVARRLTKTGFVIGTPPYMAPEQIEPAHWGAPHPVPATDLFAFGVVAWELLVGGHPTGLDASSSGAGHFALVYRKADGATSWPPDMPTGAWRDVVRRCLALRPEQRYPSAGDVLDAMQSAPKAASARARFATEPDDGIDDAADSAPSCAAPAPEPARDATTRPSQGRRAAPAQPRPEPPPVASPVPQAPPPSSEPRSAPRSPASDGAGALASAHSAEPAEPAINPVHVLIGLWPAAALVTAVVVALGVIWLVRPSLLAGDDSDMPIPVPTGDGASSEPSPLVTATQQPSATQDPSPAPPAPTSAAGGECAKLGTVRYRARLSVADHYAHGESVAHAYQVLQEDRIRFAEGKRDKEDEASPRPIASNVNHPDMASLAWCFPAAVDSSWEGKRVKRGAPLVEVSISGGHGRLTIVQGDCEDLRANLTWIEQHGSGALKAWAAQVNTRIPTLDSTCSATLSQLRNHPHY